MRIVTKINTDNVEFGMEFKNYYKLCEALDIKPSTNRVQQLNAIGRYMDVQKIKGTQKYVIKEIYDLPYNPKKPGRKRKNTKIKLNTNYNLKSHGNDLYGNLARMIILKKIVTIPERYLLTDNYNLHLVLGMCNQEYIDNQFMVNTQDYADGLVSFNYYYSSVINPIIQNILCSMSEKRNLMKIENVVVYTKEDSKYILANDKEYQIFKEIVEDSLQKYNINNYGELFYRLKNPNMYQCIQCIKDNLYTRLGWISYARKMKLTLNPTITDADKEMINQINISKNQKQLNNLIINHLTEYITKKGQTYYKYDPNEPISMTIGTEDQSIKKRAYEEFCSDLEKLLDKYIRI